MKTQNPLIGRFKGSAGGMTGAKVYDKNVLRAKAFEVNNPNTQAQQTQRNYFAELSALVASLTDGQLRAIFPSKPKSMSRRNALSKQLSPYNSVDGNVKSVNLANLKTLGNAPTMVMGITTAAHNTGKIVVTLDESVSGNTTYGDNYFIAALVNVTQGLIVIPTTSAKVSVGTISPDLPSGWLSTDSVTAIPFITNSLTAITGFGTLSVATRPER